MIRRGKGEVNDMIRKVASCENDVVVGINPSMTSIDLLPILIEFINQCNTVSIKSGRVTFRNIIM